MERKKKTNDKPINNTKRRASEQSHEMHKINFIFNLANKMKHTRKTGLKQMHGKKRRERERMDRHTMTAQQPRSCRSMNQSNRTACAQNIRDSK